MIHHIQQQYLHINLNGTETDGLALQRRLSQVCYSSLLPALERILDQYAPPNGHLFIDYLEIDAGSLTLDKISTDLAKAVAEGLERAFRERIMSINRTEVSENVRRMTEQQSVEKALLHFLETGRLPWSFRLPTGQNLEQVVLAYWQQAPDSIGEFRAANDTIRQLLRSPTIRQRLLAQFSPVFWQVLVARLWPVGNERIDAIRSRLNRLEESQLNQLEETSSADQLPALVATFERQLWDTVFTYVATGGTPTETELVSAVWYWLPGPIRQQPALVSRLARYWPDVADASSALSIRTDRSVERPDDPSSKPDDSFMKAADWVSEDRSHLPTSDPAESIPDSEGIYVDQAGIVLLHPFLPRFFEHLAIAKKGQLIQPDRALGLLHYLATGQRQAPEYELTLAKVLCNVPLATPVKRDVVLTEAEIDEANALLHAVIRHWEALRNTSPDGLRGTFLTRSGKLSLRSDGDHPAARWLLQVESGAYDILLSQLPWGLSVIKLPWMERMLWIEWN